MHLSFCALPWSALIVRFHDSLSNPGLTIRNVYRFEENSQSNQTQYIVWAKQLLCQSKGHWVDILDLLFGFSVGWYQDMAVGPLKDMV